MLEFKYKINKGAEKMKINKVFGKTLKERRKELGFTLREVGERTNIAYTTISDIENGKVCPKPKQLIRIATLYGNSPEEILSETERNFAEQFQNACEDEEFKEGQELIYERIEQPLREYRMGIPDKAKEHLCKSIKLLSRIYNGRNGFDPVWTNPLCLDNEDIEDIEELMEEQLALIFKNIKKIRGDK